MSTRARVLSCLALFVLLRSSVQADPPKGDVASTLDRWLTSSEFKGAALVASDGNVLLRKGYGQADRERSIPYAPETVSTIGSITKQFTAAAILKLEMQGQLHVEDTIDKYLPGVPEDKRSITLHQLLTHTSGLESDFAGDYDAVTRDEYVRRVLSSKLRTAPGSAYHYANSGYSLLGAIVEIVSAQGYETFLREQLFLPSGMRETGYVLPKWDARRVAVGYRAGERWGRPNEKPWATDGPYWALRANGGILSTVDDLLRWHTALEGTEILSAAAKKRMFTPHVREGAGDTYYGYGWMIGKDPWGGALVAHNGGNGVFFADFVRMIDAHLVVILMTNDSTVRGGRIAESLARLARGEDVPVPRPSATSVTPLGAGPREAIVRAWLDAFNAPELGPMRAWREAHAVPRPGTDDAERERRTKAMRDDLGQLELEGQLSSTGEELTVRAKSAHGPVTLRFMFADDGKVDGIGVEVGD
jgi:CubicO group peptidase (beta-lactamase class C family)